MNQDTTKQETEKYHRCPTCGHDWLECHGPGQCPSVVFHRETPNGWLPMEMACDDCVQVRTPAQS